LANKFQDKIYSDLVKVIKMIKEKAKIVLMQVSGKTDEYWKLYPPLGLGYLASYVIKYAKIPRKNIIVVDSNMPDILNIIEAFKPDIIGYSCFSNNYKKTISIAKKIRQRVPCALFMIGGVHISLFPQTLHSVFDLGVPREGEDTFLEIVKLWSKYKCQQSVLVFSDVRGIIYREKGEIKRTLNRPMISLEKIPPIEWSVFSKSFFRYEVVKDSNIQSWNVYKVFPLFTSRGCPYNCVFCARNVLWKRLRYFSVKRVVKDIKILYEKFGVTAIQIWDDTFTLSIPRLQKLERELRRQKLLGKVIFYRVFARTDLFDQKMADQLGRMFIKSVVFGLESGSERILKYLKKNTVEIKDTYRAIELCEKKRIGFIACVMLGISRETELDMKKTLKLTEYIMGKKTLEILDLCKAVPFPGTELYEYALRKKLLPHDYGRVMKHFSLTDGMNSTPMLIKGKKEISIYRKYWRKIKLNEILSRERNQRQKDYRKSIKKMMYLNSQERKLFIFRMIIRQLKFGNVNFLANFFLYKLKKIVRN